MIKIGGIKMIIGYTTGVFDLFHIGHLWLLKNAKSMCDRLVVGVTVDELVSYKGKKSVIPFEERIEIISSIKYVDAAIPQYEINKIDMLDKIKFDILFVGDDWYGDLNWKSMEEKLSKDNVKVVYFPYFKGQSSTKINTILEKNRTKNIK